MKKGFLVALFLLLLLSPALFAQKEARVVPPSPEASSVFKFAEVPVSLFTGLPNISVPLYEIKLKNMTIPIQLGYHAHGIRVEEIAPRVGLGWALSYGGMISRQVRDKPDDGGYGFLYQDYYNDVFTDAQLRGQLWNAYILDMVDMTPDQFFFDMNGVSGKFVFDQASGDVFQQKYSDIKITYANGESGIASWIVTDDRGNKYYYGRSKDGQRTAVDYDELLNSYVYTLNTAGPATLGSNGDERPINSWPSNGN